ncbi:MAG: hypothetical protein AVDCRST_MAG08-2043, partial [uncultured Acetobacteraceae bacterium]
CGTTRNASAPWPDARNPGRCATACRRRGLHGLGLRRPSSPAPPAKACPSSSARRASGCPSSITSSPADRNERAADWRERTNDRLQRGWLWPRLPH